MRANPLHLDIPDANDFDFLLIKILGSGRGDGDLNRIMNFSDFSILSTGFGIANAGWADGNYNIDTVTDFGDFVELSTRFGQICPCGADTAAVPEPAAMVCLAAAVVMASRRLSRS